MFVLEQNGTAKKLTGQTLINDLTKMLDGHGGIQKIEQVSTSGLSVTYRMTFADTTTFDLTITNGRSITEISKTSTAGLVDTYTISYNDGTTDTITVTNGEKGETGDAWYVHIKYASQEPNDTSHSFGDRPDSWIGIYSGTSATAPTNWEQYQWYEIKGEKGETGDAATLLSSAVEYQESDSGTIIPSGAWTSNIPVVAQGSYLWTRTTNTYNTGSPVVAYSVSRYGIDGSGSVSSVNNQSPDANGNVEVTAENIGALSLKGGVMEGSVNMNGQSLTGLNDPTSDAEAANKKYVDQTKTDLTTQIGNVNAVPASTTSDNGKFLTVVNGVATWSTMTEWSGGSY